MKAGERENHNRWCARLEAPEVMEAMRRAGAELAGVLDGFVEASMEARGVEAVSREGYLSRPPDERFKLRSSAGWGGFVLVSPILPGLVIRKVTGSERVAIYPSFRRAASLLVLSRLAAPMGVAAGAGLAVEDDLAPFPEGRFERLEIVVLAAAGGNAGMALLVPASIRPPESAGAFGSIAARCSVAIVAPPLPAGAAAGLAPGDLVRMTGEGGGGILLVACATARERVEVDVRPDGERSGRYVITGEPREVRMQTEFEGGAKALREGGVSIGCSLLPVRIEVCSFEMPMAKIAALSKGSIVDTGEAAGERAVMYVCGAPFASGRIERHEDFSGFKVERVF